MKNCPKRFDRKHRTFRPIFKLNSFFSQRLDDDDMLDTKSEHLIIDGQVQFGDDEDKPSAMSASNSNQDDEFEIISPDQIYVSGGAEFSNDDEFVDSDGVKLVRIRIADEDGKEQMAWVNVVTQDE